MQVPTAPPVVVVISGPSGVGKDAVVHALKQEQPDLHFVVTATSRYVFVWPLCAEQAEPQGLFMVSAASASVEQQQCLGPQH